MRKNLACGVFSHSLIFLLIWVLILRKKSVFNVSNVRGLGALITAEIFRARSRNSVLSVSVGGQHIILPRMCGRYSLRRTPGLNPRPTTQVERPQPLLYQNAAKNAFRQTRLEKNSSVLFSSQRSNSNRCFDVLYSEYSLRCYSTAINTSLTGLNAVDSFTLHQCCSAMHSTVIYHHLTFLSTF